MPLLLHTVRQNRWLKAEAKPWLDKGDVPADPIGDLRTNGNRLSVWELVPDRSNLERIVRAIAVGRDKVSYQFAIYEVLTTDLNALKHQRST